MLMANCPILFNPWRYLLFFAGDGVILPVSVNRFSREQRRGCRMLRDSHFEGIAFHKELCEWTLCKSVSQVQQNFIVSETKLYRNMDSNLKTCSSCCCITYL